MSPASVPSETRKGSKDQHQPPAQKIDIVDKNSKIELFYPLGLKQKELAAREAQIEILTEAILDSFESAALPKESRMDILSEAFMRCFQITELGTTLLSEEELVAPPKTTWKDRDKSRKQSLEEHLVEQFKGRINRGFARKHLQKADSGAYAALSNQISQKKGPAPEWLWEAGKKPMQVNPLEAISYFLKHRC